MAEVEDTPNFLANQEFYNKAKNKDKICDFLDELEQVKLENTAKDIKSTSHYSPFVNTRL